MALLAVGCQKDGLNGRLLLLAEGYNNDTKLAINGATSNWADGDKVLINGVVGTVQITGSGTTVDINDEFTAPYYGVYPSTIYSENTGSSYILDLPATYTYAVTDGKQNLESPMVAYAASGNTLVFKHLTAAVTVHFVNYYGFTVEIDSIVVSSNKYKLNGTLSGLTINGSDPAVSAVETVTDAEKKVKMIGGSTLRVFAGDSINVQVPVLPVGDDNKFTIKVKVHKVDQSAVDTTFEKTQATAHNMARAEMGYARFATPGLFSVSASKKVVISQGNLQYQASSGTWKFSETQYGYIGNAAGNNNFTATRSSQSDWIDLFGWGTSGWNNGNYLYQPYSTQNSYSSGTGYGFGPKDGENKCTYSLVGDYVEADWGYHNRISNGGNMEHKWRVMTGNTGGEWEYLINTRSVTNRFAQACVNEKNGYIVFSDDYSHPQGLAAISQVNKQTGSYWNNNVISSDDWEKMEAAGAIFIPTAGYSNNKNSVTEDDSYYWTSTYKDAGYSYYARCGKYSAGFSYSGYKYNGYSVRLVRDVQ